MVCFSNFEVILPFLYLCIEALTSLLNFVAAFVFTYKTLKDKRYIIIRILNLGAVTYVSGSSNYYVVQSVNTNLKYRISVEVKVSNSSNTQSKRKPVFHFWQASVHPSRTS